MSAIHQFLLWENLPSGNAIIWAKHCDSKLGQTRLCVLHLHHVLWGLQGHSPTKMGPRHPQHHAQPHLGGSRKEPERPQSLSAIPRLLAFFLLASLFPPALVEGAIADTGLCYSQEHSCGLGGLPRQKGTSNELFGLLQRK